VDPFINEKIISEIDKEDKMEADTLLAHASNPLEIRAYYKMLELIGEKDVIPARGESWFDDIYDNDYSSEYEIQSIESWMDDLDEAA
jgi:hypothetical protein